MITGRARRWRTLWPLFAFLFGVGIVDQVLLHFDLVRVKATSTAAWTLAWQAPFRAAAANFDPRRPQLLIVGSSRAETILLPYLTEAAGAAGLPHQVSNLGVSYGTPALIWSGLNEITPFIRQWPPRSHIIYIFSNHELPGLQVEKLVTTEFGRTLLARHTPPENTDRALNDVPVQELKNRGLRILYPFSGLIQLMVKAPMLLPPWVTQVKELRWLRAVNVAAPRAGLVFSAECKTPVVAAHPANAEALESLAAHFGTSLTVSFAPRHPVSRQCHEDADREAITFVGRILQKTGGTLVAEPDSIMLLPVEDYQDDGEHVVSDHGRRAVAEALVRLVP